MQLAERNYKIYDKELLAIIEALIKQRQYLLDTTKKFEVWTDHENLKYFRELHKLNDDKWVVFKVTRLWLYIVPHTRKQTLKLIMKEDNKDVQMLKDEI